MKRKLNTEEENYLKTFLEQFGIQVIKNIVDFVGKNGSAKTIDERDLIISKVLNGIPLQDISLLLDYSKSSISNINNKDKKLPNMRLSKRPALINAENILLTNLIVTRNRCYTQFTKSQLYSKCRILDPHMTLFTFGQAYSELEILKAKNLKNDKFSCDECDDEYEKELNKLLLNWNIKDWKSGLDNPLFVEAMNKKFRVFVEQLGIAKSVEQFNTLKNSDSLLEETHDRLLVWQQELRVHKLGRILQQKSYHNQKSSLTENTALMTIDLSLTETKSEGKIWILNFSYITKNGPLFSINYHDFFCKPIIATSEFLEQAFKIFLEEYLEEKPELLYIWTDRGGADFMNDSTEKLFWELRKSTGIPLIHSTFWSKHGKSISDTHFGRGKTKAKKDLNLESSSKKLTFSFVQTAFSKLSNTTTHFINILETEDITDDHPNDTFKGISKYRCFDYRNETEPHFYELSSECPVSLEKKTIN